MTHFIIRFWLRLWLWLLLRSTAYIHVGVRQYDGFYFSNYYSVMLVETSIQSIVWAPAAHFIILDSGFRQNDDLGIRENDDLFKPS